MRNLAILSAKKALELSLLAKKERLDRKAIERRAMARQVREENIAALLRFLRQIQDAAMREKTCARVFLTVIKTSTRKNRMEAIRPYVLAANKLRKRGYKVRHTLEIPKPDPDPRQIPNEWHICDVSW